MWLDINVFSNSDVIFVSVLHLLLYYLDRIYHLQNGFPMYPYVPSKLQ